MTTTKVMDGVRLRLLSNKVDDCLVHINRGSLMEDSQVEKGSQVRQSKDCDRSFPLFKELLHLTSREQTEDRHERHQEPKLFVGRRGVNRGVNHNHPPQHECR